MAVSFVFVYFQHQSAKVAFIDNTKKGDRSLPKINYFCIAMYKQLTSEQRYGIYLGLQEKKSISAIARQLEVSISTVSREIRRNKSKRGVYSWRIANEMAQERRELKPNNRRVARPILKQALHLLVTEDWSPQQISGYLANKGVYISHETIYKYIRADESGELKKHCRHQLKYRRHIRRPRKTKVRTIPNRLSIHDRPAEANGTRFGDWEMDLILGKQQKSAIVTLCERSTNFMIMRKLPKGKNADGVADAVISMLLPYRKNVKTITTDNGSEFCRHEKIAAKLQTQVFFADSYAAWQKGAIENTNKLVRQYIPKGINFNELSDDYILNTQYKLNRRPRKKLMFNSPKNAFFMFLS